MENKRGFTDKYFLEKIYLSGYKSIQQTEIELKSNFNIIIGKNGVGKTNFMEFLNKVLNDDVENILDFKSVLNFIGAKHIAVITQNTFSGDALKHNKLIANENLLFRIIVDDDINEYKANDDSELIDLLYSEEFFPASTLIKHGIPLNYDIVNKPYRFTINAKGDPLSLIEQISSNQPYFINSLLANFLFKDTFNSSKDRKDISDNELQELLAKYIFSSLDVLKPILRQFSPIQDIRFNKNFNIFDSGESEKFTVSNLFLEFKVNEIWYQFFNLSDGTKRLFYIISEVSTPNLFLLKKGVLGRPPDDYNRIILIEEPELGIHPHQFHNLMTFLKEQSQTKQIIITTHSPEALNILNANELDSIILSTYDKEKGTLLRHMTDKEKDKAKSYIKEDFLSDYWMHSNLEPAY